MSTVYGKEKTLVRHKGAVVPVTCSWSDHRHDGVSGFPSTGNRRARQIGRRHWVRKESSGWSTGGLFWDTVTQKPPRRPEQHLRKPKRD